MTLSFESDVPTVRLKYLLKANDPGTWGEDPNGSDDTIVLRSTEQTIDGHWTISEPAVRTLTESEKQRTELHCGDLVVTKSSGSARHIGKTTLVDSSFSGDGASFGNFMQRLRCNPKAVPRFIWYLMNNQFVRSQLSENSTTSTGLANLNGRTIGEVEVPFFSVELQHAIVDFLDRETSRIDTLIAEQVHLMDLLAARRRELLRNLLSPSPNWTSTKIKFIGSTSLGKMLDSGRATRANEEFLPYIRAADVLADGSINIDSLNTMPFTSEEMRKYALRRNDILLIEGGATVGRPGLLKEDLDDIAFQKTVNRLRVKEGVSAKFCYWTLRLLYDSDFYSNHFGSVSFVHLTGEKLREIAIQLPSSREQERIAADIESETSKIDTLIAETEKFIELSGERRAALITAAVTGQIDVS